MSYSVWEVWDNDKLRVVATCNSPELADTYKKQCEKEGRNVDVDENFVLENARDLDLLGG